MLVVKLYHLMPAFFLPADDRALRRDRFNALERGRILVIFFLFMAYTEETITRRRRARVGRPEGTASKRGVAACRFKRVVG